MPHAAAQDGTRLYDEEAGQGTPILFIHEFAGDYTSCEPQVRYFSRGHRCITYSAQGYSPSDRPSSDALYSYQPIRDDALAVLDHLRIERAHLVGLSMGAYSAFQVGVHAPERVVSLTLAGVGSGSEPDYIEAFRKGTQATATQFETFGSHEVARVYPAHRTGFRSPSKIRADLAISSRP